MYTIESLLDLQIPYRNLMVLYNSMNHQSAKGNSVMGTASHPVKLCLTNLCQCTSGQLVWHMLRLKPTQEMNNSILSGCLPLKEEPSPCSRLSLECYIQSWKVSCLLLEFVLLQLQPFSPKINLVLILIDDHVESQEGGLCGIPSVLCGRKKDASAACCSL